MLASCFCALMLGLGLGLGQPVTIPPYVRVPAPLGKYRCNACIPRMSFNSAEQHGFYLTLFHQTCADTLRNTVCRTLNDCTRAGRNMIYMDFAYPGRQYTLGQGQVHPRIFHLSPSCKEKEKDKMCDSKHPVYKNLDGSKKDCAQVVRMVHIKPSYKGV